MASVTNNAARGLEDFNPFEDQNKSQGSGSKVGHFLRACVSLRMVVIQSCTFRVDSRPEHCNIVERFLAYSCIKLFQFQWILNCLLLLLPQDV